MTEFEQFDTVWSDFVGIGHIRRDEEAVARPQILIAQAKRAGDNIVQAISIVAVQRQRIILLEPHVGQTEPGYVAYNPHFIAFDQPGLKHGCHARALHRGIGLERHAPGFHQFGCVFRAKNLKLLRLGCFGHDTGPPVWYCNSKVALAVKPSCAVSRPHDVVGRRVASQRRAIAPVDRISLTGDPPCGIRTEQHGHADNVVGLPVPANRIAGELSL